MACETVRLPGGGYAIVCGIKRKKPAPCQFCGSRSTKLCDWKCDVPKKIRAGDLRDGDMVVTHQKKYRLPVHGLHRFTAVWGAGIPPTEVVMYGLVFPDKRCFLYYQEEWREVVVLRPGTCDAPCCELHSRAVDDNVDYCMEHWGSWQEVR